MEKSKQENLSLFIYCMLCELYAMRLIEFYDEDIESILTSICTDIQAYFGNKEYKDILEHYKKYQSQDIKNLIHENFN